MKPHFDLLKSGNHEVDFLVHSKDSLTCTPTAYEEILSGNGFGLDESTSRH